MTTGTNEITERGTDATGDLERGCIPAGPTVVPAIEFRSVSQVFQRPNSREHFVAIHDVNFCANRGEFVSIVGPSGCGKSTILNLVTGLASPAAGSVEVVGRQVSGVRKDVGIIFQKDALLPWRSALDNVALPLRFRGVGKAAARRTAHDWLGRVGLRGFEEHYPSQLSGGMRKRVAIAATMVFEPVILLMDEPFSALDVQTRNIMENDTLALWEQAGGQTVLFITHDLEEAIGLSDRVLVMSSSPGRIIGDYAVGLSRPRNLLEVRFEPGFSELYEKVWGDLRDEVLKAYGRSTLEGTVASDHEPKGEL